MNSGPDQDLLNGKKRSWAKWAIGTLVALALVFASFSLIEPPCPKHIVIATGSDTGAYFEYANRYREILAKDGITLEVRTTAGSVENNRLLESDDSDVSMALIQGGVATSDGDGKLGSV